MLGLFIFPHLSWDLETLARPPPTFISFLVGKLNAFLKGISLFLLDRTLVTGPFNRFPHFQAFFVLPDDPF